MKNTICHLLLSISLLLFGCTSNAPTTHSWRASNGKLKVLSTVAMIDDLVKQVGGEHVDTETLIKGELDPHSYQLVKGDNEKLSFASLIFYNGLGFEHGPSLQSYLHSSDKGIGLGNKLKQQYPDRILHYNGNQDPHIWMDMSLWAKTIPYIVRGLSEKDPIHEEYYRKQGDALIQQLLDAHEQIRNELQAIPEQQRYLVTSHDAFNYFTKAYLATDHELQNNSWQKRFAAPEGLAPDSQLSTRDIQFIIDHVKKYSIKILFPESNVSKDSIRKIITAGREMGLELTICSCYLYGDAMGKGGSTGDSYIKMLQHNAKAIKENVLNNP